MPSPNRRSVGSLRYGREADSTIAHRSHREPCLEMWPLRVWSALERSVGVSPAHEPQVLCRGEARHVPDLGHDQGRGGEPDPGDGGEVFDARIGSEELPQFPLGLGELGGEQVGQPQVGLKASLGNGAEW
jgi:hypothetical protein